MANAVESIVVCRPSGNGRPSAAICASAGPTGFQQYTIKALVLDPTTNLQNTATLVQFDYSHAAAAFAFGLTMVITFWLVAKPIGLLLGLVKSS